MNREMGAVVSKPTSEPDLRYCLEQSGAPISRSAGQRLIDFTPSARELGQALRNRETRAQKMLARLRMGPASTFDLMMLGGAGFSSRLKELRRAGHEITVEGGPERFVYTLKKA